MTFILPVEQQPIFPRLDADQKPIAITWRKYEHRIERISNSYRVPDCTPEESTWREYFLVITHTGWLLSIYHELLTGEWGLEMVYD